MLYFAQIAERRFFEINIPNVAWQRSEKMYCANCGKEIVENAKFCKYCGKAMEPNISGVVERKKVAPNVVKSCNGKKMIFKAIGIVGVVIILIIGIVLIKGFVLNANKVVIEDPLIERCIRETLKKGDDEKITLEECASIKSLLIDCQYDTSFSFSNTVAFPSVMVCNYVDLVDLKYLTGLEELYIDNSNSSDYIANFDAITNCHNLKKLYMQYDPSTFYYNGETGKGYKYLAEVIGQLPMLEYLDLGYYVTDEYKSFLKQHNSEMIISDGNNKSHLNNYRLQSSTELDYMFWADSVEEYVSNWTYKYNGNEREAKSHDARTTKAGLKVSNQEDLEQLINALPQNTEDIFIGVYDEIEEIDMTIFERFDNLKTLSIRGNGACIGGARTELKNMDALDSNQELFSMNLWACNGEFSDMKNFDNLKQVSFVFCDFDSPEFLGNLTELRELTLLYCNNENGENKALLQKYMETNYDKFEKLKFLRISNGNSLRGIEKCTSLETIFLWGEDFKGKEFSIDTFEHLGKCNSLENLIVVKGNVAGIDMTPLAKISGLETIYVNDNYVSNVDSVLQLPKIATVIVNDVTNQYDDNYVNQVNKIFDEATKSGTLSFFNPIKNYNYGDVPYNVEFSNIAFGKLYDVNILDGIIQWQIHKYPESQMTFEEAYNHYFDDCIYDFF